MGVYDNYFKNNELGSTGNTGYTSNSMYNTASSAADKQYNGDGFSGEFDDGGGVEVESMVDDYLKKGLNTGTDFNLNTNGEDNDFDLFGDMSSKDMMGGAYGLGKLGLGFLSYKEAKKNSKSDRRLANQQYMNNATQMANAEADRKYLSNLFNG